MDAIANGNNVDAAVNGNNENQGDPPHHENIPPPAPNDNNQPPELPPAQPSAQPPAVTLTLPTINGDLGRALQVLQLQQQVFQRQQQEIAQQHERQIASLTNMISELTTHVARGQSAPNTPGGTGQNASNTAPPNHVLPPASARTNATPQRNGEIQGITPLSQSTNAAPQASTFTATFEQPPNYAQRQPARDVRLATATASRAPSDDRSPQLGLVDTDADGEEEDARAPTRRPILRGRGRERNAQGGLSGRPQNRSPSTDVDDNDGYAVNREKRETHCKSINIKAFSISDKEVDFPVWVTRFEEAVNRGFNPHSKRRHDNYCLQWLSGSLDHDAYSIWRDSKNKSDWEELKKELEDKFEDPAIRKEWRDNPSALKWDEYGESLQCFIAKVKRKVNTYDEDIAPTQKAKEAQYYARFVNGMPADYMSHLNLRMPSKNPKLSKALEAAIRFQAWKKGEKAKPEVGASVAFEDPTMPSRVTKNTLDIKRLDKCIQELRSEPPQKVQEATFQPRSSFAGRSPRRPFDRPSSNLRQSPGRSDQWQSPGRSDRWNRYNNRGRGAYPKGNSVRFKQDQGDQPNKFHHKNQPQGSLEESLALISEPESATEELDDTIADFERMEQMDEKEKLEYFGALRDRARAGN